LEEVQYVANEIPGPGNYSPVVVKHQFLNKNICNRNYWIKKNMSPSTIKNPEKIPGVGYYNP